MFFTPRPDLTVVIPARNEADILEETLVRVEQYLVRLGRSFEIIVGDSASTDGTGGVALRASGRRVRVVRDEAPGKGRILSACLAGATGRYIGFIDADLEIPETMLGDLIAHLDSGADAAIAAKDATLDRRPWRRRAASRGINRLLQLLFRTPFSDHQAGCKMFRASFVESLLPRVRSEGWLWDTEMLVLTLRAGGVVAEVPTSLDEERRPSRVGLLGTLRSLGELIHFRFRYDFGPRRDSLRASGVGVPSYAETFEGPYPGV